MFTMYYFTQLFHIYTSVVKKKNLKIEDCESPYPGHTINEKGRHGLGLMPQLLAYILNGLQPFALWTSVNLKSDFVTISQFFPQRERLEKWTLGA